ncbi:MAG: hypothetical protein E7J29_06400 [Veillonella sp.]|uniref:hypothetical protein n=1 Tax=Veillonella sp. TaxID=1926307 RepID=UPI00290C986F|nr:hypothetical protein [Veillonella sp.]MDU7876358.1 hypothetical protein [Veillonella sp.]MDU7936844.1 hypothetical protein [Veillonella sp.]
MQINVVVNIDHEKVAERFMVEKRIQVLIKMREELDKRENALALTNDEGNNQMHLKLHDALEDAISEEAKYIKSIKVVRFAK